MGIVGAGDSASSARTRCYSTVHKVSQGIQTLPAGIRLGLDLEADWEAEVTTASRFLPGRLHCQPTPCIRPGKAVIFLAAGAASPEGVGKA